MIGAGVIGFRVRFSMAPSWFKVVVFEALDAFLPMAGQSIGEGISKNLEKQGLDIRIGAKVSGAETNGREVTVKYNQSWRRQRTSFDKLIVCVGRRHMQKVYWQKILALN